MYNIQQVIDRYKGKIDERNNVTGYLAFGGHQYYLINSDEPLQLNSNGMTEFIINEQGQVQHYAILDDVKPKIVGYYLDEDYTKRVTKKEINKHPEWESHWDYFPKWNDGERCKEWWGETVDKYYLHPWFPDKEIVAFEVIRLLPGLLIGTVLTTFNKEYCLEYPEFFRPLYKDGN